MLVKVVGGWGGGEELRLLGFRSRGAGYRRCGGYVASDG